MEQEPDWAVDDPEIAALLTFTPVERKNKRHDGWSPAHQRGFVAWLAASGNVDKAAQAVGRTQSGAWTVRNSLGAEGFSDAWEAALALFHARRRAGKREELAAPPAGQRHTLRHARETREAQVFRGATPFAGNEPDLDDAERNEIFEEILTRYLQKLKAERQARLEGRIVEADFYVRQLTFIELVLDLGGRMQEALAGLGSFSCEALGVSATPGSTLLERARRAIWEEKGEADRPPPAPLGKHDDRAATGRDTYDPERDGDYKTWQLRRKEQQRLAAEAQEAWERRGRAERPEGVSPPSWARAEAPAEPSWPLPGPACDNDNDNGEAPEPAA